MATTQDYLTQLQIDKENLVNNLVEKGVEATTDETFTSLVPKVLDIQGGGGDGATYTGDEMVDVYDSFEVFEGGKAQTGVVNGLAGNLIYAFVYVRSAITYDEDWTLQSSFPFTHSNITATVYVFTKLADETKEYTFHVEQEDANLTHLVMLSLRNSNKVATDFYSEVINTATAITDVKRNTILIGNSIYSTSTSKTDTFEIYKNVTSAQQTFYPEKYGSQTGGEQLMTVYRITDDADTIFMRMDALSSNYPAMYIRFTLIGSTKESEFAKLYKNDDPLLYNKLFYNDAFVYSTGSNNYQWHKLIKDIPIPIHYSSVYANRTTLQSLFNGCPSKTLDVRDFETTKITDMSYVFSGCENVEYLDLSNWDTSKVTTTAYMFSGCKKLKQIDGLLSISNKTKNTSYMFNNCSSLESLDITNWDTSEVTNMSRMFYGCKNLKNIDLSKLNTSKATSIDSMFGYLPEELDIPTVIENLDLSALTTFNSACAYVTMSRFPNINYRWANMNYAFQYSGKEGVDFVFESDLSNVTYMSSCFSNFEGKTLTIKSDIPKVTTAATMFHNSQLLEKIDLTSFVGGQVSCSFKQMFQQCYKLKELLMPNLLCYGNVNISYMFSSCPALEKIDMRSFDFTKITTASNYSSFLSTVPETCEIIVMNDNVKTWFNTNFSAYTNVKTVDEYIAEGGV